MQARYLLTFRTLLVGTLVLYSLHAPGTGANRPWLWAVFALHFAAALTIFSLGHRRRFGETVVLSSFILDIAVTSLVLYLTEGFRTEFYIAYFLVILSTCFLEKLSFSFIVGGVTCVVYAYFAYPGGGELQPLYLLRGSLLLVTAFFSAYVTDSARRIERETEQRYAAQLAWLQRLSMVGRAMSAVLHEAKTPLSTILLCAEQIRELLSRRAPITEPVAMIEQEAGRTLEILVNFLDFARPRPLELSPIDLAVPLKRAMEAVRLHVHNRDVELAVDLTRTALVLGSERHLVQAFTNIMLNAVQAMPLGGRLAVAASVRPGIAVVEFSDTGVGMSPETIQRLFEPFFTEKPETGHGIGLTVVRWIVQKHAGDLRIASEGPRRGATITVSLPLLNAEIPQVSPVAKTA